MTIIRYYKNLILKIFEGRLVPVTNLHVSVNDSEHLEHKPEQPRKARGCKDGEHISVNFSLCWNVGT